MDYSEAVAYIESLSPTLGKPGLSRFQTFMQEEGNKQDLYPSIHVAGTNGKGSVVAMLAETLNKSGYKTGRYTGPHLISINERFEIGAQEISHEDFAGLASRLRNLSEDFGKRHPEQGILSWFELLTAIAFYYFAENHVDAAVFEVGLGGRFDATNLLSCPLCTCIVNVSLDHIHILGSTVAEIAAEKAGILKAGVPLVTACQDEALQVVLAEAARMKVPVLSITKNGELKAGSGNKQELDYVSKIVKRFQETEVLVKDSVNRQKGYQRLNAKVAAAVLGIWEIESGMSCLDKFDEALKSYFWPGRLQYFKEHEIILDGAHNPDGAKALRETLAELFAGRKKLFILSFYSSKQFQEIMQTLVSEGDLVFASQTEGRRPVVDACKIADQARLLGAQAESFSTLEQAFESSMKVCEKEIIRIGTGSFATVAAGLKFLGYNSCRDSFKAISETK